MFTHSPKDYVCPICLGVNGVENDKTLIRQSDIFYKDKLVTAFISSFFIGVNKGHVVVVPNNHVENMYDLPKNIANAMQEVIQKIATAVRKSYPAEGITILQNNEPAGDQHAFHYHVHIFPRYEHDSLHEHMMQKITTTPEGRLPYAEKLKVFLKNFS